MTASKSSTALLRHHARRSTHDARVESGGAAMKVMLRATNWVGDAVMSLPALSALRAARPQDEIVVVARPWVANLYETLKVADRVMTQDPKRGRSTLAAELRAERFDLAILFPN